MIIAYWHGLTVLAIMLLFLNFNPSMSGNERIPVVIEFNSIYSDFNLLYLRILGYDFEVVDNLHNVMQGAVIMITPDQIERLKSESVVSYVYEEKFLKTNLDKSLKLIGAVDIKSRDPNGKELTGEGIRIAVVDTGIDYTHPDLLGFGKDGKVVGGYDFLERDGAPMDTDGHGTLVAGIIAADGSAKGVAPKADLIAYRIASEGDYVSTVDMIRALDRAIDDEIDIMNISLGLDYISEEIDKAIEKLVSDGVVVVTAAGNNGQSKNIGSPASSPSAISIGASLNNVTMSAGSTLKISNDDTRYDVIPMLGSVIHEKPVTGKLVFGKFAKADDLSDIDVGGAIVLAERGGPIVEVDGKHQTEIVYFTDKEMNAARNGAVALLVYNNMPGNYHGTLINDKAPAGYQRRIPVVSISMEQGLMLRKLIENGDINSRAELRVFYNPDIVAPFSSRGPVSPFYLKPTLVAPGAFINSTSIQSSYNITSGTSFAAPHVAGAAALLLQKNPELKPNEVASIFATTAEPVNDAYGFPYSFDATGAGRLNVDAALNSKMVASPYYAIIHLSADKQVSKQIEVKSLEGVLDKLNISIDWDEPVLLNAHVESNTNNTADLIISAKDSERALGKYEGRVYIESEQNKISIPVTIYVDEVTLNANNKDGRIWLSIDSEDSWTFAKVKVINAGSRHVYSGTLTPSNNLLGLPARDLGEHWIEADVITDSGDVKGFSVLYVNEVTSDGIFFDHLNIYGIPFKEGIIIASFLGLAAVVVYAWTKRNG
ncbi:MAG: S8 family serine peptidase, partial [Nitrososphaerales archaeon]